MRTRTGSFLLLLTLLSTSALFAQRTILDSLVHEYKLLKDRKNYQADTTEVNLLIQIAKYGIASDSTLTKRSIARADSLSHLLNYKAGRAAVLIEKGRVASMNGSQSYEEALKHSKEAEELAYEAGRMDLVFYAINNQAAVAFRDQDYEMAYNYFQSGIDKSQAPENSTYLSHYQMNIGVIFTLLENHEYANIYLDKAIKTHRSQPGNDGIFPYAYTEHCIIANLAYTNWKLGKLEDAKLYSKEALFYFLNEKDELWVSFVHSTLAESLMEQDSIDKAQKYYRKNLKLIDYMNGRPDRIGLTYLGLGKIFIAKSQIDSAFYTTRKAHSIFKEKNLKMELTLSSAQMAKLFSLQQQMDSAFFYQELSEQRNEQAQQRLIKANLTLKESERKTEIQAESESEKKYQQQLMNGLAIIAIIVVLVVLFFTRSRMKREEETKHQLEELNSLKDQVFKFISQDLTVPMNTLSEVAELSESKGLEALQDIVPSVKVNLDHSGYVLTNFHYWTQAQKKRCSVNPAPINVLDAYKKAEEKLLFFGEQKELDIEVEIDPKSTLQFDPLQFDQVLQNLLCNAVRFIPEKGKVFIKGHEKEGAFELHFSNKNSTFSQDEFNKAVDLTTLYRTPSNEGTLGTGIGLSVSYWLAQYNQGELFFHRQEDELVTVVIKAPLTA
ncbi:ATP-binding protein [Aureicoccus marinus]|uniref:histidine kinase n=1 Tax=Aureicoccus marinus TaxID=754435 RepID=A0A2S7T6H6_9FLAO|nr:HAMP domain-containing sensor histidine kinase [Aureicoccus marinus]PQJ15127.1 hypothetical protein BST99_04745 [Aureicoccus marinus]